MLRKEAEKLIGTSVTAWTSANGVYVGVLEAVGGSPWRGSVRITGVLKTPTPWERGRFSQRKCLEIGRIIDVGGMNISPAPEGCVGDTPLEAWKKQLAAFLEYRKKDATGEMNLKDRFWIEPSIKEIQARIAELEA